MDKVKRERSVNFTLQERDVLISLVQKYQTVLENKKSDACTWKQKEAAWGSIQHEFNARSGGVFRSIKTLKVKYEGLKRTVRKKSATIRSELYRTGGGKNTATPLDNVEEQIKTMISLSTEGLESVYDSDILPQAQGSQDDINFIMMEEFIEKEQLPKDVESAVIVNEATQNEIPLLDKENTTIFKKDSETNTIPETKTNLEDNVNDKDLHDTTKVECSITPTTLNKKWDATSRSNLRSRKHPALSGNVQTKSLFDKLTQSKLELVELQKELLQTEILEKKKEWEFKEKERKWKEEEYKLKLEKLKKELNE